MFFSGPPKIFRVPEDLVVLEGDDISFDCLVIGNPVPEQIWLFDNILVVEDPPRITIGAELYGTLSINNVMFEEEGIYTCIYNSTIGFIDTTAQLTVQGIKQHITPFLIIMLYNNYFHNLSSSYV